MKLNTKKIARKVLTYLLLLISIVSLFSSQFKIVYTEESQGDNDYYKIGESNVKVYSLEKDGDSKLTENFMVCD